MKKALTLFAFLFAAHGVWASEETMKLDHAAINVEDRLSLQRGARNFVNYCLSCHSASYMRYSRLQDLGLTEKQVVENLMFTAEKPVETMTVALRRNDAKEWFGAAPPDLTVVSRSRDPDWLYTYLRSFYVDPSRPTGWNNLLFHNVGMPHVLWDLQGKRIAHFKKEKDHDGNEHEVFERFEQVTPGKLSPVEYDAMVRDLVNYLTYMGEPAQVTRKITGIGVLLFLGVLLLPLAYYLKKEFWKDIH